MRKIFLLLIFAVAVAAIIYAVSRPEPTPTERLSDALQEASDAVEETVGDMSSAMSEITTEITNSTAETLEEFSGLLQSWRETGIITESGVDFEAAAAEIRASDMDDAAKEQSLKLIELLRSAPEEANAQLRAIEEQFK